MLRKIFVFGWLMTLLCIIVAVFWYNDWKYRLPTPVPANYRPVAPGTRVDLTSKIAFRSDKPLFLHFYNPQCPCSRFNSKHFQSLVRTYGDKVQFIVIVLSDKKYEAEEIQDKIGLNIPVVFDKSIADQCGVYATPQAAIFDNHQKLYYRGNYNASRYCTDEKTAYAKTAVDHLLENPSLRILNAQAIKSYGCSIPLCKNTTL